MTEISRRSALHLGAAGAVVAVVAPLLSSREAHAATARRLYRRGRFRRQRGKRFRATGDLERAWSPRLTAVKRLSGAPRGDDGCFTLVFTSKRSGPAQGTYTFRRRRFAATELFVVPTDERRRTYLAVVNRP